MCIFFFSVRECLHNNMSRLKLLKLSTLHIFKMVCKGCFIYISYICIYLVYICFGFSLWMMNIKLLFDSCWYRQLIPLTHTHVSLPSAIVCLACSSAAFWSNAAVARRQQLAWCVPALKIAYIKASLQKGQLVGCSTLWCNSVNKDHLRRRRSMPASTSLPI